MNETFEGNESEFPLNDGTVRGTAKTFSDCATDTLEKSKSYIRTNPMPTILGALAVGVAIGLLMPRCEEEEEPVGRLSGKLDDLKDLLSSLGGKVSSTAENKYDDLSSVLGATIKKAKKRFNFS